MSPHRDKQFDINELTIKNRHAGAGGSHHRIGKLFITNTATQNTCRHWRQLPGRKQFVKLLSI